ncbi:SpoIID/LytB domain-containing protein [bacterium]|nr:SpoIID/LytB domain-containing protein [bacterium]
MKRLLKPLFVYILLTTCFLVWLSADAMPGNPPMIRVLIKGGTPFISIKEQGGICITAEGGKTLGTFKTSEEKPLDFLPLPSGISINGEKYDFASIALKSTGKNPIKFDQYLYRGEIVIFLDKSWKLGVINRLGIEEYIKGLMKAEISPSWSFESLKAQAVIARTYALYQLAHNTNSLYDLKASTESQVYLGVCGEDPMTDHAVDATRGQALIYENDYIPALYHACCGGHTEDARYVFHDHLSLVGVPCSYCKASPHFEWENQIGHIQIRNLFLRQYFRMGVIKSISVMERSSSGRAENIIITHSLGQEIISGKQLRALLGHNTIRSTLFTIIKEKDAFVFKGKGWGHGVGLCQWGAKAMAEEGYKCEDILTHYYPLSSIVTVY